MFPIFNLPLELREMIHSHFELPKQVCCEVTPENRLRQKYIFHEFDHSWTSEERTTLEIALESVRLCLGDEDNDKIPSPFRPVTEQESVSSARTQMTRKVPTSRSFLILCLKAERDSNSFGPVEWLCRLPFFCSAPAISLHMSFAHSSLGR